MSAVEEVDVEGVEESDVAKPQPKGSRKTPVKPELMCNVICKRSKKPCSMQKMMGMLVCYAHRPRKTSIDNEAEVPDAGKNADRSVYGSKAAIL
jgi:hypothetical protein